MTVVTFRTKTEVFEFLQESRFYNIQSKIISMPAEIKIGCGYAVEIPQIVYATAYMLIKRGDYPTFNGIFSIKKQAGRTKLERLV